ncbi:MAG: Gfo/Idh/MocA family oxidoreductase [Sedimentisphaerales bacterium]|nr:Gfo/Idh/MocA family oxidoreductase [Sedimentisphaerales bacterium]
MKIGIIGAENSHTAAIATIINIWGKIKDCSVDYVWGETAAYAKAAAKAGKIKKIVTDPKDMLGKIDAVIVDHRHPKYHLKAVLPFVKAGVPTFVDKPFCYRAAEGKEFLAIAKKHKTPVTSFSVLPHQKSFARFLKKIEQMGEIVAGDTYGASDFTNPWGGVFFYGIHQLDVALKAFGYDVASVQVIKNGDGATGQLIYPKGKIVTMHMKKNWHGPFAIGAMGAESTYHQVLKFDASPYLGGVKCFTDMFKTGVEPESHMQMLRPVQVLEALEKSGKSGQKEKVIK